VKKGRRSVAQVAPQIALEADGWDPQQVSLGSYQGLGSIATGGPGLRAFK